jgi:hypothetical protein
VASGRCGGVGGRAFLLNRVGTLAEALVMSVVLMFEVSCGKIEENKNLQNI